MINHIVEKTVSCSNIQSVYPFSTPETKIRQAFFYFILNEHNAYRPYTVNTVYISNVNILTPQKLQSMCVFISVVEAELIWCHILPPESELCKCISAEELIHGQIFPESELCKCIRAAELIRGHMLPLFSHVCSNIFVTLV